MRRSAVPPHPPRRAARESTTLARLRAHPASQSRPRAARRQGCGVSGCGTPALPPPEGQKGGGGPPALLPRPAHPPTRTTQAEGMGGQTQRGRGGTLPAGLAWRVPAATGRPGCRVGGGGVSPSPQACLAGKGGSGQRAAGRRGAKDARRSRHRIPLRGEAGRKGKEERPPARGGVRGRGGPSGRSSKPVWGQDGRGGGGGGECAVKGGWGGG